MLSNNGICILGIEHELNSLVFCIFGSKSCCMLLEGKLGIEGVCHKSGHVFLGKSLDSIDQLCGVANSVLEGVLILDNLDLSGNVLGNELSLIELRIAVFCSLLCSSLSICKLLDKLFNVGIDLVFLDELSLIKLFVIA